jgi:hypothetical protein
VGGVGEATNATGLPTAARKSTQRFGHLTFGISLVSPMVFKRSSNAVCKGKAIPVTGRDGQ